MDIKVSFGGNKKVDAQINGYKISTDQPTQAGGNSTAPAPYELFLASLGTCAGIYVLGFLQSRNLPIEGAELIQKHAFDPTTSRLSGVELQIQLPPEIPEKYHGAIARAAGMCAVKKALADPPNIGVTIAT
ncbi:MAG: OsmC family protein [Candidatus Lernaella stagnicola]|nr:OsmC family protein [Candidatus Lernaella stagnicola]